MKEIKHTPGPWETIEPHTNYTFVRPVDREIRDGQGICELLGPDKEANARLIAAAPELLEALKVALIHLVYPGSHPAVKVAKEAIAKAEGEGK